MMIAMKKDGVNDYLDEDDSHVNDHVVKETDNGDDGTDDDFLNICIRYAVDGKTTKIV